MHIAFRSGSREVDPDVLTTPQILHMSFLEEVPHHVANSAMFNPKTSFEKDWICPRLLKPKTTMASFPGQSCQLSTFYVLGARQIVCFAFSFTEHYSASGAICSSMFHTNLFQYEQRCLMWQRNFWEKSWGTLNSTSLRQIAN